MALLDDESIYAEEQPLIRNKRLGILESIILGGIVLLFLSILWSLFSYELSFYIWDIIGIAHLFFAAFFIIQWRKISMEYDKQIRSFFRVEGILKTIRLLSVGYVIYSLYQTANLLFFLINSTSAFPFYESWSFLIIIGIGFVVDILLLYYYYLTYTREREIEHMAMN